MDVGDDSKDCDAAYWREKALAARRLLSTIPEEDSRETLRQLADSYEYLAKKAEGWKNASTREP